jgi:hypothetical protein
MKTLVYLGRVLAILAVWGGVAGLRAQTGSVPTGADASAAATPAPALPPDVLAKFGDTQIKTADIRAALTDLPATERESLNHDPELLKKTITTLILQRMVLKQAIAQQWDEQPGVAAELKRVHDNALVQSYLGTLCRPPSDFPGAADLQRIYDANKGSLIVPRQLHMAQIFVSCPPGADPATVSVAEAKFEAITKSLGQASTDFSAIARTESDDKQSGERGGEIGWVAESQIQPEIRSQLPGLTPGTVSRPVRLKDGWHFLKVLEVKEAHTPSLDQVRDQLIQQVRARKAEENTQAYLAKLLRQTPVTINPPAVVDLTKKD